MATELKSLTRKERVLVSINCDSFYLSTNKTKTSQPVFDSLRSDLKLQRRYHQELWMVITMVGRALISGCNGSQITFNTRSYKFVNEERGTKLDSRRARYIIDLMEDLGYLKLYLGFKDLRTSTSMISCVMFEDKLTSLFTEGMVKRYKRSITVDEMVEVKDSKTKNLITKLTRFKGVGENKRFMLDYNQLLSDNDIRYGSRKAFVQYKQVFSDDLEGAGRIYSFGSFQTMPSFMRGKLVINGEKCTEVDLRFNHIAMLYLMQGIVLDENFDCYSIDLNGYDYQDVRSLCKLAIMCIINTNSLYKAGMALANAVKEDSECVEPYLQPFHESDVKFFHAVVKKLVTKHKKVDFFPKGVILWKKLQRLDSRVCEKVLEHFTKRGEVVLGWHDSWVVRKALQQELIEVVRESWFKVFGTYDNCFLKVEF